MGISTYRSEGRWLGVFVQLHEDKGGWFWVCPHHEARLAPGTRFPTARAAILSAMAKIYQEAVDEEVAAVDAVLGADLRKVAPSGSVPESSPPPHGGGGG